MIDKGFVRGVKAAAGIASMFDKRSSHESLVSDVILCKLNVVKRKFPRINRHHESDFLRGFALALGELNRRWDMPTNISEVMRDAGVTLKMLRQAGVEPYDVDELARCVQRKRKTASAASWKKSTEPKAVASKIKTKGGHRVRYVRSISERVTKIDPKVIEEGLGAERVWK